jgi:aryl-alcohol dehydrogenase-like predicted oxidoreductase
MFHDCHQKACAVQPAQVTLAWLLSLGQVVVIPGASNVEEAEADPAEAPSPHGATIRAYAQ